MSMQGLKQGGEGRSVIMDMDEDTDMRDRGPEETEG